MSKAGNGAAAPLNRLYFGDNLDVLRAMPGESVDLIYLDPPWNSNAHYNVLYGTKRGGPSQAQSHAFRDTWSWGIDAQRALEETAERHLEAGALLDAFQKAFGGSNIMAYLAIMAIRLIEMQRVLKNTGSLYLHCDPTASHYLKLLLDAIFGPAQFRTEISWRRQTAHNDAKQGRVQYGNVRDVIFFYTKSREWTWNWLYTQYGEDYKKNMYKHIEEGSGRRYGLFDITGPGGAAKGNPEFEFLGVKRFWRFSQQKMNALYAEGRIVQSKSGAVPRQKRYLDEMPGVPLQNDWNDIAPANGKEALGYQTQKPLALLERIIAASSNEGDVVLDPFCGCGTAIEAAQRLKRKWIGIDVTYLAIHVIEARLVKAFGPAVKDTYKLLGKPQDAEDARVLAARDWLEFQKWAVFSLGGLPKDRPGPDGGIDGMIRYHRVGLEQPNRAVVSVKGGQHVGVDAIHKLKSVVQREKAQVGVLVCLDRPTAAMEKEALSEGEIGPSSRRVQRLQIVTVDKIFTDHPINLPGIVDQPEIGRAISVVNSRKGRQKIEGQTEMLFALDNPQASYKAEKPRRNRQIHAVEIEVTRPASLGRKTK
jgi:DNA modification methylase